MKGVSAVIPAAGLGKRFLEGQDGKKKQFIEFNGKPLLYYTLTALKDAYSFDEFVIGASEEDFEFIKDVAAEAGIEVVLVEGGAERADTVLNAVKAAKSRYVLIHDAVRPFISKEIVKNTIEQAFITGGAICGISSRDTVKKVSNGTIVETIDRNEVFLAHTPQVFLRDKLIKAMENAKGAILTDEASAFELARYPVAVVQSSPDNIKVTVAADLPLVKSLMKKYFDK